MDKRKRRLLCMLEGSGWKSRWISGAPPLSFKALAAGELENYRIYGNTVGGESVGDKTWNLFDGKCYNNNLNWNTGSISGYSATRIVTDPILLVPGTYTFSNSEADYIGYGVYDEYMNFEGIVNYQRGSSSYTNATNKYVRIICKNGDESILLPNDMRIMLNEGSTALPYEPYGYKVPLTVSNGTDTLTTPIYLPEQIRKAGDEAEYIDYGEQKMHRIGADDIDVTLPALPVATGTNVLTVGTAVQPSEIEVKGKIKSL